MQHVRSTTPYNWGTLQEFWTALRESFATADAAGDARAQLRRLRQGKTSVDDYVNQFRILATKAGITDEAVLIDYFVEGLNRGITSKIFGQPVIPKTISGFYTVAGQYDANYRRQMEINTRSTGGTNITPY